VDEKILTTIYEKNKMWKQIRCKLIKGIAVSETILQTYRELKNKIKKAIEQNKQNEISKQLNKDKTMWETINNLTKTKKESVDDKIKKNFKDQNTKNLTETFNKTFVNLTDTLKEKYERDSIVNESSTQEENKRSPHFVLNKVTVKDFVEIIQKMKLSEARGTDEFCLKHFKDSAHNTAKILTHLTNCIIDNQSWPKELKMQVIRPTFKKRKKNEPENYRPNVSSCK